MARPYPARPAHSIGECEDEKPGRDGVPGKDSGREKHTGKMTGKQNQDAPMERLYAPEKRLALQELGGLRGIGEFPVCIAINSARCRQDQCRIGQRDIKYFF